MFYMLVGSGDMILLEKLKLTSDPQDYFYLNQV